MRDGPELVSHRGGVISEARSSWPEPAEDITPMETRRKNAARSRHSFYCAIERRKRVLKWLPWKNWPPYTKLPLAHGPTDGLAGHGNRASNAWRGYTDCQEKRSVATNERKKRIQRYECDTGELPVVLGPDRRNTVTICTHCKIAVIVRILCTVVTIIINARTIVLYWLKCINVVFLKYAVVIRIGCFQTECRPSPVLNR